MLTTAQFCATILHNKLLRSTAMTALYSLTVMNNVKMHDNKQMLLSGLYRRTQKAV